jgi:hypothetical protein
MPRLKPNIKIPYKRYEKSFERPAENAGEEETFIVHKDITANPSVATTNLRHERPGEGDPDTAPEAVADSHHQCEETAPAVKLNKLIKIRRKSRNK